MDKLYNYQGTRLEIGGGSQNLNCKIIAHRGYHAVAAQNTIAAFVDAAEAGFTWIEIDIRKTADGMYVMSHDNTVTMYNNGSAVSVTVSTANYSVIKSYTWDAAGVYKLCTLQAVFNAMKLYDMRMILDLKNGSNAEVMEIAALSGAVDRVMLTWKSGDSYDLYKKYDTVPVRIYASYYSQMLGMMENTVNPLYADMNVQGANNDHISKALAAGVPLIFSGCTLENAAYWQVLASGVMANADLNIPYDVFRDTLDVDYDVVANITASVSSLNVSVGGSLSLTAQSDISTPGGYVYAYTVDPTVATVSQTQWGKNITLSVAGVSSGATTLRLFTGSGAVVNIPVSVT